jgi:hypothetical protein
VSEDERQDSYGHYLKLLGAIIGVFGPSVIAFGYVSRFITLIVTPGDLPIWPLTTAPSWQYIGAIGTITLLYSGVLWLIIIVSTLLVMRLMYSSRPIQIAEGAPGGTTAHGCSLAAGVGIASVTFAYFIAVWPAIVVALSMTLLLIARRRTPSSRDLRLSTVAREERPALIAILVASLLSVLLLGRPIGLSSGYYAFDPSMSPPLDASDGYYIDLGRVDGMVYLMPCRNSHVSNGVISVRLDRVMSIRPAPMDRAAGLRSIRHALDHGLEFPTGASGHCGRLP